jgi:hypothetical protein
VEANKFIEKKFFNRHFFLEAINESNHPIDFIADLMEEWEQLHTPDVVGRSEQCVCSDCVGGRDEFEPNWKCPNCRRNVEAN